MTAPTYTTSNKETCNDTNGIEEVALGDDRIERALRRLRKIPIAVSGNGGHNTLRDAVLAAVGGGLDATEAYELVMHEYNPRCRPPRPEKEVRDLCVWAARARSGAIRQTIGSRGATTPIGSADITKLALGLDQLDAGYRALLGGLRLTQADRTSFHRRGLTDEEIDAAGYRSAEGSIDRRRRALDAMRAAVGDDLTLVPGVIATDFGPELNVANGIVVPVRDTEGHIVGLRVRTEQVAKNKLGIAIHGPDGKPTLKKAYVWVSGRGDHQEDARSGAPVHVPLRRYTSVMEEINRPPPSRYTPLVDPLLQLQPTDLLVFIDETGHEELADARNPVFGFGAAGCIASAYRERVAEPWWSMKASAFGGRDQPLHAVEVERAVTPVQIQALKAFFETAAFFRLAAVLSDSTRVTGVINLYEAAAGALLRCVGCVLEREPAARVVLVFESSQRGDPLAKAFFPLAEVTRFANECGESIPIFCARMTKADREPGLEVADFIAHTSGAQVRRDRQPGQPRRRDFDAIFNVVDGRLVEFMALRSAATVRVPVEPGVRPGALVIGTAEDVITSATERDDKGER